MRHGSIESIKMAKLTTEDIIKNLGFWSPLLNPKPEKKPNRSHGGKAKSSLCMDCGALPKAVTQSGVTRSYCRECLNIRNRDAKARLKGG